MTPARPDGRFAPSPTGPLHLGNLRTALLAWLLARGGGARFVVRIDDLDTGRARAHHIDAQLADLAALGLDWDGSVERQSDRGRLYERALEALGDAGLLYECWCTRREIREAASAPHGALREGAYPGTCAQLDAAGRAERVASGRPPALRVRANGARVAFDDGLAGRVEAVVDDFVVRRNDGAHAYNLAVVVDDDAQGIREVVRGRDLLETTARQRWLAARLAIGAPAHIHVPLLLGDDGERLAKRHGATTLAERAALGQDAATVRGELAATLGLWPPGERPSAGELLSRWDRDALLAALHVDSSDGPGRRR